MKRLIFDLDETLTSPEDPASYEFKNPNIALVEKLRKYKSEGFTIIIQTARNMRTFEGSIGKINAHTLPVIIDWLRKHEIPFDELHVGKPWCGTEGFYVDDKAIRPAEFIQFSLEEIQNILIRDRSI